MGAEAAAPGGRFAHHPLHFPRRSGRASRSWAGSRHTAWVPARPGANTPGNCCQVPGGLPGLNLADKGKFGKSLPVLTGKGERPCPSSPCVLPARVLPRPHPKGPPQVRREQQEGAAGEAEAEGKEGACPRLRDELGSVVILGSFQATLSL